MHGCCRCLVAVTSACSRRWVAVTSASGQTTANGIGKLSQAGLSLLDDIDSSTGEFCTILSRDLVYDQNFYGGRGGAWGRG